MHRINQSDALLYVHSAPTGEKGSISANRRQTSNKLANDKRWHALAKSKRTSSKANSPVYYQKRNGNLGGQTQKKSELHIRPKLDSSKANCQHTTSNGLNAVPLDGLPGIAKHLLRYSIDNDACAAASIIADRVNSIGPPSYLLIACL